MPGASTFTRYSAANGPVVFGLCRPAINIRWNPATPAVIIETDDTSGYLAVSGAKAVRLMAALIVANERQALLSFLQQIFTNLDPLADEWYRVGKHLCRRTPS